MGWRCTGSLGSPPTIRRVRLLALLAMVVALGISGAASRGAVITPLRLIPNAVAFWDRDHGLIGTGNENHLGSSDQACRNSVCQPGTISSTSDGGHTTRVLVDTPGPVISVAVAPRRQAWAIVRECKRHRCSTVLWHSADAGAGWSVVGPTPVTSASWVDARHGFAAASDLIETVDGGRTWRPLRSPCPGVGEGTGAESVSFATVKRGWLVCNGQPGAGNEDKSIYRTDDGAMHWRRIAWTQSGKAHGGIDSYGYPVGIAFDAEGLGVLWESRGTIYLTRDGGYHWRSFPNVSEPDLDFGLSATVAAGRAFVLVTRTPQRPVPFRLLATTSNLNDWQTIRTWRSPIR